MTAVPDVVVVTVVVTVLWFRCCAVPRGILVVVHRWFLAFPGVDYFFYPGSAPPPPGEGVPTLKKTLHSTVTVVTSS